MSQRLAICCSLLSLVAVCACGDGDAAAAGDGGLVDGAADATIDYTLDTDNDTIVDYHETLGTIDTDDDGVPDTMDSDSDGDGYSDMDEAGDVDPMTAPFDTDADGTPDFRDRDSDNDGLPDASEAANGTNRVSDDSDGDGVNDLVEVVAGTDPTSPDSNPRLNGDFYFLVPYEQSPVPTRDTLVFDTTIQVADVHFMIDTSISMQDYIDRVRTGLTTTIVPGIQEAIADVQFGVGQFDVCPSSAYVTDREECVGISQAQISTSEDTLIATALDSLTADCSGVQEPYTQSAWAWATGGMDRWPTVTRSCPSGGIGLGCVREGALPILILIGDEHYSESYNTTGRGCAEGTCNSCFSILPDDVTHAFNDIRARLIVMGPTAGDEEYEAIVSATGAVDADGHPLLFPSSTALDLDTGVVDAVTQLMQNTPLDLSTHARDLGDDAGDALQFIDRIVPNTVGGVEDPRDATRICVGGLPTSDTNDDGVDETFPDVPPRTSVCFDVIPLRNSTVQPTSEPQLFRAAIDIIGDDVTVLDTRNVYFLVPPASTTEIVF